MPESRLRTGILFAVGIRPDGATAREVVEVLPAELEPVLEHEQAGWDHAMRVGWFLLRANQSGNVDMDVGGRCRLQPKTRAEISGQISRIPLNDPFLHVLDDIMISSRNRQERH